MGAQKLEVCRKSWTEMLYRIADDVTRKNSREVNLHFTTLSAASACQTINAYGGTILRCLYSRTNQTMFMTVLEPSFAEVADEVDEANEAQDCQHDEFEDGCCMSCGTCIQDTQFAYEYEHDSNDLER